MMSRILPCLLLLLLLVAAFTSSCTAFAVVSTNQHLVQSKFQQQQTQQREKNSLTLLQYSFGHNDDDDDDSDNKGPVAAVVGGPRRRLFLHTAAALTAGVLLMSCYPPLPAHATYSAYSHREDDWKQRQASGDVQFSSAASLRSQLKEMVPQNDSGRLLFCPNGPTAAVSPLMENKCGDKLAMPSVYGRTEDKMGNSIPGFAGGFYSSGMSTSISSSSSSSADIGSLPSYSKYTTGK